ncbi:MAG: hypothetical protein ACLQMF_13275 [Rectinemataceae bacterium]
MGDVPINLALSPRSIVQSLSSRPASTNEINLLQSNPAGIPVISTESHECGPNCPLHFFSITRNSKMGGIDILA